MLKIEVPQDKNEIKKQIAALEWAVKHDTNEKDRNIHTQSLKTLQGALKRFK
jgi:hypothetical protein